MKFMKFMESGEICTDEVHLLPHGGEDLNDGKEPPGAAASRGRVENISRTRDCRKGWGISKPAANKSSTSTGVPYAEA